MESITVWLLLLAAVVAKGHSSPGTAANEYYVGFLRNLLGQGTITLFITTTESVPVPFTVSSSTGQIYSDTATNSTVINVTLPSSFAVFNDTIRDGGVWVRATDVRRKLTVYGMNDNIRGSTDGFVALPCHDYQKQNYTYYAVSTYFGRTVRDPEELISEVLLVGCEDSTELTITPTQTIEIPSDLVGGSNSSVTVTSGGSYTVTLDRLQTFLLSSTLDLTGSKVVSNKPIAFFSGHECADVPVGVAACDHLVEQLPPTITWGRRFFVASSLGKIAGEQYKVITSAATTTVVCYCYTSGGTVSETFITTLNGAGRSYEFHIAQNMFCSVQASSPILLVQFAIGAGREPSSYGDPFMTMIPPSEQYSSNYTFVAQSGFENAITVTVASEFFNTEDIILNGNSLNSANWTEIYCSTQTVCGYGTQISVSVERNFVYHRDSTAKIGTIVYGFRRHTSYGYPAGMLLIPISATSTHIKPTGYYHVTTATTAIVKTPLDSRAQPVATEHAVPSSTQFSTLSFVIGLAGGGMLVIIVTSIILMVVCVVMKRRQTRNIAISISAAQREKMDMEVKEAREYEVPVPMIEMKECEAYAPLPNRS